MSGVGVGVWSLGWDGRGAGGDGASVGSVAKVR